MKAILHPAPCAAAFVFLTRNVHLTLPSLQHNHPILHPATTITLSVLAFTAFPYTKGLGSCTPCGNLSPPNTLHP